ncbi:MAG: class I SAM-dependent methyltransferase [Saprospiraceae bacterium]|nr:class I SAM-dependent methyltransferase [Saprospiraceae bacterium]
MKEMWNSRYGELQFAYGTEPNVFFKEQIDALPVGKILLPSEGEGRNAVYAASLGWDVVAFDFSAEGKQKALQLAESQGVTIRYFVSDAAEFDIDETFDVVALIYAHLPPSVRKAFNAKIPKFLKPNGLLIAEVFSPNQILNNRPSGGPKDVSMVYDIDLFKTEFPTLKVLIAEELTVELSEGLYHNGLGDVVRFVGQKV